MRGKKERKIAKDLIKELKVAAPPDLLQTFEDQRRFPHFERYGESHPDVKAEHDFIKEIETRTQWEGQMISDVPIPLPGVTLPIEETPKKEKKTVKEIAEREREEGERD